MDDEVELGWYNAKKNLNNEAAVTDSARADTAVYNLLAETNYRTVRARKFTSETSSLILWPQFSEWLIEKQLKINPSIIESLMSLSSLIEDRVDVDKIVESHIRSTIKASNVS